MKAQLITITEEMTGSTELAEALNQNFDALNDMAHQREMAIFNKFNDMERRMEQMEANIIKSINQAIERRIVPIEKRLERIEKHLGVDPDLLQED